jgi:hypothetical protein
VIGRVFRTHHNFVLLIGLALTEDVLQGGTEAVVDCPSNFMWYYAWVEWYPFPEVRILDLFPRPGDTMMVSVTPLANGQGSVLVYNYNQGKALL